MSKKADNTPTEEEIQCSTFSSNTSDSLPRVALRIVSEVAICTIFSKLV
jgi:hypothetical protein